MISILIPTYNHIYIYIYISKYLNSFWKANNVIRHTFIPNIAMHDMFPFVGMSVLSQATQM